MKTADTYLIAKYIPDLRRMEPRNIGVILRAAGNAYCRFLAPRDVEEIVRDSSVYTRWVNFWEKQVQGGSITLPGRKPIAVDSPEFLDALKETQKENYALDDGGEMVASVPPNKGSAVVDFLFQQLVATKPLRGGDHDQEETFAANAYRLLAEAGITTRGDYQGAHEVECEYEGIKEPLRFHHYIGNNGTPRAVLHRVKITSHQSVNSTAWMFERLQSAFPDAKRGSIVNTSDLELGERRTKAFLSILGNLSTMIDLADEGSAMDRAKRFL